MNIAIIGASAGLGLETVKRGLNRNHAITTLSRSEIKIEENKLLKVIKNQLQGSAVLTIEID